MRYNKHARQAFSYNPEAAEPDFAREDFVDGTLQCECCEEIIPGGEIYFDIPHPDLLLNPKRASAKNRRTCILCESCTRDIFSHVAPYFSEVYDDDD